MKSWSDTPWKRPRRTHKKEKKKKKNNTKIKKKKENLRTFNVENFVSKIAFSFFISGLEWEVGNK